MVTPELHFTREQRVGPSFFRDGPALSTSSSPTTIRKNTYPETRVMSRPIEQALANLIPRHPGALPHELIELAGSLLAQSRNKCSNLKPEEEIARTYACANLACERYYLPLPPPSMPTLEQKANQSSLKTSLNLPPIEPRPPIPPRLYTKLYAYFDRTLLSTVARQRAQAASLKARSTPVKALPQRLTPSKEKSFEGFKTQRTGKKGLLYAGRKERDERVPGWVAPVVRLLCREMGTGRAVPHILAGVESVLCLPCPNGEKGEREGGRVCALVAAVWFFVVVKMRGKERQGVENLQRKKRVREVLAGARTDEGVCGKVGIGDENWVGWEEDVQERDVNKWRKEIVGKGWREMDWWENIEEGCGVEGEGGEMDVDEEEDEESTGGEGEGEMVVQRGGGKPSTMIQQQFCVTEEKRVEYKLWKEAMLAKIEELIADGYMERDD